MLTTIMMQGTRRTKVRDVGLNEYWSGGLSASQSCSAGQPQTKYRLVLGKVQTPLQDRTSGTVRESIGKDMGRSYALMPSRPKKG